MWLVRRADNDESFHTLRIPLGKRERDHASVRRADERMQPLDAKRVEHRRERIRLIVRRDNALGASVVAASTVEEIESDELILRGIERATAARETFPPTGTAVGAVGADVSVRGNTTEHRDGGRAAHTSNFEWRKLDCRF